MTVRAFSTFGESDPSRTTVKASVATLLIDSPADRRSARRTRITRWTRAEGARRAGPGSWRAARTAPPSRSESENRMAAR